MKENIRVFDLHRMFFGDEPSMFVFEIVVRTTILYLFALLLLRLLGKRGKTQLTIFEFAVIFSLGAAIGDPMMFADVPIVHGMVVVTSIVLLQRGLVHLSERNPRFETFVQGSIETLVFEGTIRLAPMRSEGISRQELFIALRESGVEQLGQVRRAFLETTGTISVFTFPPDEARPGLSLLPPHDEEYERPTPQGTPAPEATDYACWECGHPERFDASTVLPTCSNCHRDEGWVKAKQKGTSASSRPNEKPSDAPVPVDGA